MWGVFKAFHYFTFQSTCDMLQYWTMALKSLTVHDMGYTVLLTLTLKGGKEMQFTAVYSSNYSDTFTLSEVGISKKCRADFQCNVEELEFWFCAGCCLSSNIDQLSMTKGYYQEKEIPKKMCQLHFTYFRAVPYSLPQPAQCIEISVPFGGWHALFWAFQRWSSTLIPLYFYIYKWS